MCSKHQLRAALAITLLAGSGPTDNNLSLANGSYKRWWPGPAIRLAVTALRKPPGRNHVCLYERSYRPVIVLTCLQSFMALNACIVSCLLLLAGVPINFLTKYHEATDLVLNRVRAWEHPCANAAWVHRACTACESRSWQPRLPSATPKTCRSSPSGQAIFERTSA